MYDAKQLFEDLRRMVENREQKRATATTTTREDGFPYRGAGHWPLVLTLLSATGSTLLLP